MRKSWAAFCVLAALVATAPAATQSKVRQYLSTAEDALASGDYEKAEAHIDAIRPPTSIRVFVDWTGVAEADKPALRQVLDDAMQSWNAATGESLWEVSDSSAAVRIGFTQQAQFNGQTVAGRATWTRNVINLGGQYVGSLRAQIVIGRLCPDGTRLSNDALRHTAMHELGHVLGLEDGFTGVMGPMIPTRPAKSVSESDLLALLAVRQRALCVQVSIGLSRAVARRMS